MKVIITGATGFIGKHLQDFLLLRGFEVISIVRNKPLNQVEGNLFLTYEEFYKLDINDLQGLLAIVHLAGAAHKEFTNEEAKQANETLTRNIVNKSKSLGIKRFIFVSTIGLYKEQFKAIDLTSTPNNTHKNTNYYKLQAEKIVKLEFINCSTDYVVLRLPLVYGKEVKANFSLLMKLVGKNLPLPFGAINSNKRSLISVYNLIDLIRVCIAHPRAANQTFLVSDGKDLSTAQIVKLMAKVQGVTPKLLPFPIWLFRFLGKLTDRSDMISSLVGSLRVDITHVKKTLDWIPPFSVEEGFKKCVENTLEDQK